MQSNDNTGTIFRGCDEAIYFGFFIWAFVPLVYAASPIPEESGWSGFVNLGLAGGSIKSNTLAEIIGVDLGDNNVANL